MIYVEFVLAFHSRQQFELGVGRLSILDETDDYDSRQVQIVPKVTDPSKNTQSRLLPMPCFLPLTRKAHPYPAALHPMRAWMI